MMPQGARNRTKAIVNLSKLSEGFTKVFSGKIIKKQKPLRFTIIPPPYPLGGNSFQSLTAGWCLK